VASLIPALPRRAAAPATASAPPSTSPRDEPDYDGSGVPTIASGHDGDGTIDIRRVPERSGEDRSHRLQDVGCRRGRGRLPTATSTSTGRPEQDGTRGLKLATPTSIPTATASDCVDNCAAIANPAGGLRRGLRRRRLRSRRERRTAARTASRRLTRHGDGSIGTATGSGSDRRDSHGERQQPAPVSAARGPRERPANSAERRGSGRRNTARRSCCLRRFASALTIFAQGPNHCRRLFGDGLRCVGGSTKRLYSKNASSGTALRAPAGDRSRRARPHSARDPLPLYWFTTAIQPTFCTPATFDASSAVEIHW
jgi:hypothetical protein